MTNDNPPAGPPAVAAPPAVPVEMEEIRRVVLVGVELPFGSMCWFIFKWSLATIPTALFYFVVVNLIRTMNEK